MNRLDKEARKADKITTMDPEQLADYVEHHDACLGESTWTLVIRQSLKNQARMWRALKMCQYRPGAARMPLEPPRTP